MSGRTIAEIIWGNDDHWRRPTVDDLLAWLDAQGFPVGVAYGNGACDVISFGLRRKLPTFTAPTLLAALEAAVRAVAGEDEQ